MKKKKYFITIASVSNKLTLVNCMKFIHKAATGSSDYTLVSVIFIDWGP